MSDVNHPLPPRLWGDGENPGGAAAPSNTGGRVMMTQCVCTPGIGAQVRPPMVPTESTECHGGAMDLQMVVSPGRGTAGWGHD